MKAEITFIHYNYLTTPTIMARSMYRLNRLPSTKINEKDLQQIASCFRRLGEWATIPINALHSQNRRSNPPTNFWQKAWRVEDAILYHSSILPPFFYTHKDNDNKRLQRVRISKMFNSKRNDANNRRTHREERLQGWAFWTF